MPSSNAQKPVRVTVLMAVYNGARYLDEQLSSIERQTVDGVDMVVSDDGSFDGSRALLESWRSRWSRGNFTIVDGPKKGFAENFRSLMVQAPADADFVAFSDQDDVWEADKLAVATGRLSGIDGDVPALYCSRTRLVDDTGAVLGQSPLFQRSACFRNAIVQSIAGGNTMVLNGAGQRLMAEASRRTGFVSHDWWCYMMVSGAGGTVIYDPEPHINYRQHPGNLVGDNVSFVSQLRRLKRLARGEFSAWSARNLEGLDACQDLLDADAQRVLGDFRTIRNVAPWNALRVFARSGIHRQSRVANLALAGAIVMGKL